MQSVSRLAVWYVLLQGSSRWSTISVSREFDSGVCDVGNRVDGLVHQVAGKALGPANKHVRSEVGSWKHVSQEFGKLNRHEPRCSVRPTSMYEVKLEVGIQSNYMSCSQ